MTKQAVTWHKVICYSSLIPWVLIVLLRDEMSNVIFDKQLLKVLYKDYNSSASRSMQVLLFHSHRLYTCSMW